MCLEDAVKRMVLAGLAAPALLVDSSGQLELSTESRRFLQEGGFRQATSLAESEALAGAFVLAAAPGARTHSYQQPTPDPRVNTAFADATLRQLAQPGVSLAELGAEVLSSVATPSETPSNGTRHQQQEVRAHQ